MLRFRFTEGVEEVVLATGPHSSFCGSSQCLLIGNVTCEVDVKDQEDRGRTLTCKQKDEDECACDIMGDMVKNLFLRGRHNHEILSLETMHTRSVSQKEMCVQKCNTSNSVNN